MAEKQDIMNEISDEQMRKSLLLSQFILFSLGVMLHILFQRPFFQKVDFVLTPTLVLYYVLIPSFVIISIDFIFDKKMPKKWIDDGGINDRLFRSCTNSQIFVFTLLIACCEEYLFRYVIQGQFGWVIASLIFALVHVRYLSKIVLFLQVVTISFVFGWIYKETDSLAIVILLHWTIDLILGLYIKKRQKESM